MSASLAEHLRDTEDWWLNVHGRQGAEEREWCRWVAYERWLNGKELLSVADPQPPWWEKQAALEMAP